MYKVKFIAHYKDINDKPYDDEVSQFCLTKQEAINFKNGLEFGLIQANWNQLKRDTFTTLYKEGFIELYEVDSNGNKIEVS
jgi:hypothetical protein